MIVRDLVSIRYVPGPGETAAYASRSAPVDRVESERYIATRRRPEGFVLDPVPTCGCCGSVEVVQRQAGEARCERHRGRNPCAIEGCKRSTSAPESGRLADDSWFCGEHWRRYVPPRSLRRRAYHAFWRQAKRHGWTTESVARFHRFWDTLVSNARHKAQEGTLDPAAINRLFGFEDES